MEDVKMLIEREIDALKEDIIASTIRLIKVRSVEDEPQEGMPFGKGVNDALVFCEELCRKLGFETKNFDGYALEARFGNQNEDVCVIGHLDIVPEGEGWSVPPYEGVIKDGKIYGRGAIDDKGPSIAALYGMYVVKKLAEEGKISLDRSLRFVFGTNEESGSKCLQYYFKKAKYPTVGFTPDADFPVIQGEKGFLVFELSKNVYGNFYLEGGERLNMVPDSCIFSGDFDLQKAKEIISKKNLEAKAEVYEQDGRGVIKTKGVSAHGSLPFKGENAISYMFDILQDLYEREDEFKRFIEFYNKHIGYDIFGKGLNIAFEDQKSGKLVLNAGMVKKFDDKVVLTVNIRYPVETVYEEIEKEILNVIKDYDVDYKLITDMPPLYFEEDHFLIKTLLDVYKEFTGDDGRPLVIGGGTYARWAKNVVAFGPNMPGDEEVAHQKDEYIAVDRLLMCAKIYANAIYRLAKKD
ncbi:dipeptidase PepV [Caldicellulosiruptor morganii]|uniref:Dipeptidase PepV n=1 Tax=Caldicellulosiruptor morganii TaxID=1387555 RepID=A0ABY7BRF6_9FIRM|nr:dipeptidase PepV [Caldicellulosiruptor morganii]WAM34074.1 dipeptidase PepV [Caldicellulosiruptor morganii]